MDNIGDNSLFMNDHGSSDNKEVVIDYFLSWTLRCASQQKMEHPLVTKYARDILFILLGPEIENDGEILEVRTWKQFQKIDLWVEVETTKGIHSLLIETKAYSSLHSNQLERYKSIFEHHYSGKSVRRHYAVVVLKDDIPMSVTRECERVGYTSFSLETIFAKLKDVNGGKLRLTGSDLFDEFWFGTWW